MRRFSLVSVVAAALVASAAWAAKPSHAAVTLGSDLVTTPANLAISCFPAGSTRGCLFVNDVVPGRALVSPFDGVIVRWRVRVGDLTAAQMIRIRVVRRFDPDQFTLISSGALEPIPSGAGTYTFSAQLPLLAGDQVAGESGYNTAIAWWANVGGASDLRYSPSPADGGTTGTPSPGMNREINLNADVEPDCDRDGLGDETQDTNISSCSPPPAAAPPTCKGKPATIVGTDGVDKLSGSPAADVIAALGGNDKASGLGDNDVICGGPGKDTLKGGKGLDTLLGQKGNDKLKGGGGADLCKGGKGKDTASKCEVEKSI